MCAALNTLKLVSVADTCPKCKLVIPAFEDMHNKLEHVLLKLIDSNKYRVAIILLQRETGCSVEVAKIWVFHRGKPYNDDAFL